MRSAEKGYECSRYAFAFISLCPIQLRQLKSATPSSATLVGVNYHAFDRCHERGTVNRAWQVKPNSSAIVRSINLMIVHHLPGEILNNFFLQ